MVSVMLLWNYLIAPIYMGYPREAIVELLIPIFLPFNLIKGGLNAAITMLFYKPIITALRHSRLLEAEAATKAHINVGVLLVALLVIVTCILFMLSFNGVF